MVGSRVDLSSRKFDLLAAFVRNEGIVLSLVRLLKLVLGYDFDVDTNVVEVFVGYLKRKLELAGAEVSSQRSATWQFVIRAFVWHTWRRC